MELNANFWNWFGDSKVVDNQGKPLVVYHGTNKSFNSFDKLKRGSVTSAKSSMDGFWFTTDKNLAGSYANLADYKSELSTLKRELKRLRNFPLANFKKEDEIEERIKELEKINTDNKHIISVYLKIENPKIIDAKGQIYNDFEENINQAIYNMNGYDGLIVKNLIDVGEDENPSDFKPSTHYMVLSSNQIKSVDNNGTWSKSNNIYESDTLTNIDTVEFRNWFRGSKIINTDGTPRICYHYSPNTFDTFDVNRRGDNGYFGNGIYFTGRTDFGRGFGKNKYECYLRITNPLNFEMFEDTYDAERLLEYLKQYEDDSYPIVLYNDFEDYNDYVKADGIKSGDLTFSKIHHGLLEPYGEYIRQYAEDMGYDGIISDSGFTEIVVFNPNQIKSVDNNGNWSNSDNIYETLNKEIERYL